MADITNLNKFLTDVADAIRTKNETTDPIPAEEFDTEILKIETGNDTSDATATMYDILYDKTAYIAEGKVTGAILPTYGEAAPTNATVVTTSGTILDVNYDLGVAVLKESDTSFSLVKIKNSAFDASTKVVYNLTDLGAASKVIRGAKLENIMTDGFNVYLVTANAKSTNAPTWLENSYQLIALNIDENLQKVTCVITSGSANSNYYGSYFSITVRPNHPGEAVVICLNNNTYQGQFNIHAYLFNGTTLTSTNKLNSGNLAGAGQSKVMGIYWDDVGDHVWTRIAFNQDDVTTSAYYVIAEVSGGVYTLKYKSATRAILINSGQYITGSTIKNINDGVTSGTCSYSISDEIGIFGPYIFNVGTTSVTTYKLEDGVIVKVSTSNKYNKSGIYIDYGKAVIYYTSTNTISGFLNVPSDTIDSMVRLDRAYYFPKGANITNSDVLTGKIAYGANGKTVGTMPNNGSKYYTPTTSNIAIPQGYHNGSGYVRGDVNLIAENIKKDVTIFNVTGTHDGVMTETDYNTCEMIADDILSGVSAYIPLNYIQTTGTQYIDTGVGSNVNNITIKTKVNFIGTVGGYDSFLWSSNDGDSTGLGDLYGDSKYSRFTYYYGSSSSNFGTFSYGVDYEIESIQTTDKIDTVINGTSYTLTRSASAGSNNITLFKRGSVNSFYFYGKLYYMQIYVDDTLVRDYVPAKDMLGNICLYDRVSKEFSYNKGTGSFGSGGEV